MVPSTLLDIVKQLDEICGLYLPRSSVKEFVIHRRTSPEDYLKRIEQSIDYIRICTKDLLFNLEATQRELEEFKKKGKE